jgi:WhiB family transcriptional regulator, redox-sensing transcriptional regulator
VSASALREATAGRQWMDRAACQGIDVSAFYPPKGSRPDPEALAACAHCPVAVQCLEYALATGERYGVWGGVSERRHRDMRASRPDEREAAA